MNQITHISQRLVDEDVSSEGQKKLMQQRSVLEEELQRIQSYDPKSDLFTVYPFVALYKRIVKFHAKIAHFYLRDNSNKHLAVIAPTRSGKGVGLIIPTLLGGWKSSVIVNDIKSENWGVTAGFRKRMGHTVIKFEPTATDGSKHAGIHLTRFRSARRKKCRLRRILPTRWQTMKEKGNSIIGEAMRPLS